MPFDPVTGSIIGSIGSSVIGGLFGSSSAKKQNKAAAVQARLAREHQIHMARNYHQYEVSDLRAAGLNPILSAGGSSPGAAAGPMAPVVGEVDAVGKGVEAAASALSLKRMEAEIENIKKDTQKKEAETMYTDNLGARAVQDYRINRAAENSAKIESQFFSQKKGRFFKALDLMGRAINPFASSAGQLAPNVNFNIKK